MNELLIAIFVIFLTLIIFILYQRRKKLRRGVILTGLCDSGKTLLMARFMYKNFVLTQTSIKENVVDCNLPNGLLRIIDLPGHERLRYKFFDQYKHTARLIAYVIDSVTIQKDIKDVAEYLYNILTDPVILKNSCHIIIVCNKQDLPLAKGSNAVKSILEKELNTLRITKANQLDSVDPKGNKLTFLGKEGADFEFSSLPLNVEFVETSLSSSKTNGDNLNVEEFKKFLNKIA